MPETKYIIYDDCTYGLDYSNYKHVTKHTRAGKNGKTLYCPYCAHTVKGYHFAWDALICGECRRRNVHNPKVTDSYSEISKSEWLLEAPDWSITSRSMNRIMAE